MPKVTCSYYLPDPPPAAGPLSYVSPATALSLFFRLLFPSMSLLRCHFLTEDFLNNPIKKTSKQTTNNHPIHLHSPLPQGHKIRLIIILGSWHTLSINSWEGLPPSLHHFFPPFFLPFLLSLFLYFFLQNNINKHLTPTSDMKALPSSKIITILNLILTTLKKLFCIT